MGPANVLVVGESDLAAGVDCAGVLADLGSTCDAEHVVDMAAAYDYLANREQAVELVILCESRRGQYSSSAIDALRTAAPLVRFWRRAGKLARGRTTQRTATRRMHQHVLASMARARRTHAGRWRWRCRVAVAADNFGRRTNTGGVRRTDRTALGHGRRVRRPLRVGSGTGRRVPIGRLRLGDRQRQRVLACRQRSRDFVGHVTGGHERAIGC